MASWFGGGTVKHTEGTMASFPVGLITFHLVLWELSSSTHSSPRFIVIWEGRQGKQDGCKYQKNREQEERGLRWWGGCREWGKEEEKLERRATLRVKRPRSYECYKEMIELIKQDEWRQRSNGQEEESKGGEIREQRGKHMNIKNWNKQTQIATQNAKI